VAAGANNLYVSVMTVILSVIVSVLASYGFSRFRFPLKDLLSIVILSTIMIRFSRSDAIFLVLTRIGLHNTLTGLVCVYVTLQLPFSIFMMRMPSTRCRARSRRLRAWTTPTTLPCC
jgi:multiple sugar transport system permease protein